VGETQYMQYKIGDPGPFWKTTDERTNNMHDTIMEGTVTKKRTKNELIKAISDGFPNYNLPTNNIKDIQAHATSLGIPVEYEKQKIKEGWLGKLKGMLQLLFERGFIDVQNKTNQEVVRSYSVNGKKDANGNIIEGTSLEKLVSNLPDFKNELTLLQFRAQQLGVRIECSLKYHPEIAGEGIEYCWGLSKNTYRRFPLSEKKNKRKVSEVS